jgi:flagellar FliJ protein
MAVNLKSMQLVVDLATRRRDHAGTQLAAALQALEQAKAQLAQLVDYTAEGQHKWQARSAMGVSGVLVQHQRAFSQKLQEAIDFQNQVIRQKEATVSTAQGQLQLAERELATLNKVVERTRHTQEAAARKREQKQVDEMAMSMLAHQRRLAEQE